MNNNFISVEDYIFSKRSSIKANLFKIRKMIHRILPHFKESMKFTIPTYSYHKEFLAFSQTNEHFNLYLSNRTLVDEYLLSYPRFVEGQSSLRFHKLSRKELKIIKLLLHQISKETLP